MFLPPAAIDDLSNFPELKQKLLDLWNDDSDETRPVHGAVRYQRRHQFVKLC